MKNIQSFRTRCLLLTCCFGLSLSASAQWSQSGTAIYPTTLNKAVGINTSAPTAQLDIVGVPSWTTADWKKNLQIGNANAMSFRISPTLSYGIGGTSSNNSLNFFKAGDGATTLPVDLMTLTSAGYLGLGTQGPAAHLIRVLLEHLCSRALLYIPPYIVV